jgi:divalent metal cation (Fe/Co/Zn/Cd) transporter
MKKALRNKFNYIFAAAFAIFGFGVALTIYFITKYTIKDGIPWNHQYVTLGIAFLYFLIGFLSADLTINHTRRQDKNWNGPLSEELVIKAWDYRLRWWFATAILLVVVLIFVLLAGFLKAAPAFIKGL